MKFLLPLVVAAAAAANAQTVPGAVLAKHEPHHHLVYEDSTLRVLRVSVPAHDTTLLHEHVPDYFWIALGASTIVNVKPGLPDAMIASKDLSVHYTPGNFAHVARNPGESPFDNITVELLGKQTNVHNLCEPALATQPLNCPAVAKPLSGTTEHPAFASDQLRVSLVTIPPGSSTRPNEGTTRPWVIALDTASTRHALVIVGPGRWVGGTYRPATGSWQLQNRDTQPVRVLVVTPLR